MNIKYNETLSDSEYLEIQNSFEEWLINEHEKRIIKKGKIAVFNVGYVSNIGMLRSEIALVEFGDLQLINVVDRGQIMRNKILVVNMMKIVHKLNEKYKTKTNTEDLNNGFYTKCTIGRC